MKRLLVLALCLLLYSPALACDEDACRDDVGQLAWMPPYIAGAGVSASVACSVDNDAAIFDDTAIGGESADYVTSSTISAGKQFVISGTKLITEYVINMCEVNHVGNVTISIYTNIGSPGSPDSQIEGTSKTISHSDVSDCNSYSDTHFALDSLYSLSAGTYWVLMTVDADCQFTFHYSASTGSRIQLRGYGGIVDNFTLSFGVWGCDG